jgi:hypothetical protein
MRQHPTQLINHAHSTNYLGHLLLLFRFSRIDRLMAVSLVDNPRAYPTPFFDDTNHPLISEQRPYIRLLTADAMLAVFP